MESATNQGIEEKRIVNAQENLKTIKRLLCGICLEMLWKPVSCATCHSNFCESCINKWLLSSNRIIKLCPNRCRYVKASSPPIVLDLLSDFQVTCCQKENGCNDILSYDQLEKHEAICGFQLKECQWCKTLSLKNRLAEHEKNCELIEVQCQGCKVLILKNRLIEHEKECEFIEVQCAGCKMKFLKKDFDNHNQVHCLVKIAKQKNEAILQVGMAYEQILQEQKQQITIMSKKTKMISQILQSKMVALKQKLENAETNSQQIRPQHAAQPQNNQSKVLVQLLSNINQSRHVVKACLHNWRPEPHGCSNSCAQCFKLYMKMYKCARCAQYSCVRCITKYKS